VSFAYARPTNLDHALDLLRSNPGARPLSGGTDLLVGIRKGNVRPPLVVDLKAVPELAGEVTEVDRWLRVAASTVISDLVAHPLVTSRFPALVEAALVVGSIQIRNRATLAGNVCNASPAADTVPPLLVHGAEVELIGEAGRRRLPLAEFLLGPGRTALGPGELVSALWLPIPSGPMGDAFGRMTRRRGVDLATVNLACSVDSTGVTTFAYGAVGPRAFMARDDSAALADLGTDPGRRDELLRALAGKASPITNVRASREYRQDMLLVLSRRALDTALRRLREASDV
jgi:CO/xanthine dehydrogenase FAD-binding subunit